MKQFISNKIVHAEIMSSDEWMSKRGNFNNHSDSSIESGRDGYHVAYNLGMDNEYHSWCPKKEFEDGNTECTSGEYGINYHAKGVIDVILGDGMTGIQSLGYGDIGSDTSEMAGIVICRDGNHNEPFGFNEKRDTYKSGEKKIFIRADSIRSLQVIIDRLEEAKEFIK